MEFIRRPLRDFFRKVCAELFLPIFYSTWYVHGDRNRLKLGKRVSLANTLFNTRSGHIEVGDGVIFGHNVMVLTGVHNVRRKGSEGRRETLTEARRDIVIERGAWIGSGVIIVGPVKIGENAVVGSGSVVVKDIAPRFLAVGNPATPVKEIVYE